jgi:pimeloyl-ACP methyl ester carboxylesterase
MTGPEWFQAALATQAETGSAVIAGARIAFRCWGPPGPGIVLIHGGGAHSRWWDHIAPLLAADSRVVALDLSGHGDSDRRPRYRLPAWAQEVTGVAGPGGITGRPLIIGHSMGGWVALTTGAEYPGEVAGVITIDSPVRNRSPEELAAAGRRAFGPLRRYASRAQAIERFHLIPDETDVLPYALDHVAQTSLRETDGAWTWKFDPGVFKRQAPSLDSLAAVRCRVAVFRAERGLVTPNIGAQMYESLGRVAPVIEIPLASHHVMLGQPLSLVTGLRTIIADWEHSAPRRAAADSTLGLVAQDTRPKK